MAGLPTWPYTRTWGVGYWPSGIIGVLVLLLLILILMGHLPWGVGPYPPP